LGGGSSNGVGNINGTQAAGMNRLVCHVVAIQKCIIGGPLSVSASGAAKSKVVTKTEKQGLVRKEGVTKKDIPAGTKFHYFVPGPVEKTESSQEVSAAAVVVK
jgi:hypothetical protein